MAVADSSVRPGYFCNPDTHHRGEFWRPYAHARAGWPAASFFAPRYAVYFWEALACTDCGARFAVRGGIYDFKAPLGGDAK